MSEFDYQMEDTGDVTDAVDSIEDVSDVVTDLEPDLDNMSLDDLYALRDELTGSDASDSSPYSFNWDGTPTHDVEWDNDDNGPDVDVKVLKR